MIKTKQDFFEALYYKRSKDFTVPKKWYLSYALDHREQKELNGFPVEEFIELKWWLKGLLEFGPKKTGEEM